MQPLPLVSVILPIRNEAARIGGSLGSVLSQCYPSERVQVIIVDGMSEDATPEIVRAIIRSRPQRDITLLQNPEQIVPTALNRALRLAKGEVIIRVDGHCRVEPDYIAQCVRALRDTRAECVGGALVTVGETTMARAISMSQSSLFGVGGVAFRTGRAKGCYVDTLAFGAYRREVFERLGDFDEELVRNQDDEFNFRITQAGGLIWMDPAIRSIYYSRSSLAQLWRQYFDYGAYKIRVIQKRGAVPSWRHLVPGAFVLTLGVVLLVSLLTGDTEWLLGVAAPYAIALLGASLWTARKRWRALPLLPATFLMLHFGYGLGFLWGMWRWRGHFRRGRPQEAA